MSDSFASDETDDGDMISVWYDINPQAQHKTYLTPGVDNDAPKTLYSAAITYDEVSPIAGLPSILFSPDDASSDTELMMTKAEAMKSPDNAFTFCAVYRSSNSTAQQYLIANGSNYSYGNFRYSISRFGGVLRLRSDSAGSNYALAVNLIGTKLNCSSYEGIKNGNVGVVKSYVNGEEVLSNQNSNGIVTPEGKLYVGSWSDKTYPFYGHLSELIIYDRALKVKELRAIEKYLAQKYEIALGS